MAISTKTPTMRILALVALVLATGVFCLRAADLFAPGTQAQTQGSQTEQTVTSLLEAVSGEGNIRVSVRAGLSKSVLILANESAVSEAMLAEIETITSTALNLDPETDTLTLSRLVFATSPVALSQRELLELLGLGLVCLLIAGTLLVPAAPIAAAETEASPRDAPPAPNLRLVDQASLSAPNADIDRAGQLAQTDPDGTARLLRRWMNSDKESLS